MILWLLKMILVESFDKRKYQYHKVIQGKQTKNMLAHNTFAQKRTRRKHQLFNNGYLGDMAPRRHVFSLLSYLSIASNFLI